MAAKSSSRAVWFWMRHFWAAVLICGALAGAVFAWRRAERFLIADSRFTLPGPAEYGDESPNLSLEGAVHAPRRAILQVFAQDFGRSVYLLPLDLRRASLLRVSWVKDASVVRVWPNRSAIRIVERQPVAFVEIPAGGISRYALIDADGVILDPPAKTRFELPVIRGVRPDESLALRGRRVHRMLRLMRDLGERASEISEVDVSDLDNLKIRLPMQNQSFLLLLGEGDFAARLRNFFDHYAEIHARSPRATTLDLRLEDRITAIEEPVHGG